MNQVDVIEAIAAKVAGLWPKRIIYRDFCPDKFKRPSSYLYVTQAEYADAAIGLVQWTFRAEMELFSEKDYYDVESTEKLRQEQAQVQGLFGMPLQVGDRHIFIDTAAEAPGPGVAYVTFSASWMDSRPGYTDPEAQTPETGGAPLMENFAIGVNRKD